MSTVEDFLSDWLQICNRGFRETPVRKLRSRKPREDRFLAMGDINDTRSLRDVPNEHHIRAGRWLGLRSRENPVAAWLFENDLLLLNADDHWAGWGRNRRFMLAEACEKLKQDYIIVSFEAMQLARIRPTSIRKIETQSIYQSGTVETAPDWAKRYWSPAHKEMVLAEPDEKGLYYWRDWRFWSRYPPSCIFRAYTENYQPNDYISSWDASDRPPRYFLSQLPWNWRKRTRKPLIDKAIDALAPPAVHRARKEGRTVVRQGDIFAIKTRMTEKDLKKNLESRLTWERWWRWEEVPGLNGQIASGRFGGLSIRGRTDVAIQMLLNERYQYNSVERYALDLYMQFAPRLRVHGTAHTATEIIRTKSGAIYGRGQLRHDPALIGERRDPDHRNVLLDDGKDGWWLLVRNTVPPVQ